MLWFLSSALMVFKLAVGFSVESPDSAGFTEATKTPFPQKMMTFLE